MTSIESFIRALDLLDGLKIRYWVDGGWGIDVLVGRQTREHRDLDIDFDAAHEAELVAALTAAGYTVTTDWGACRKELSHPEHGFIDIHPLQIDESGDARQASPDGGWYQFKAEWFTSSVFEDRVIPCLSAEAQRLFHTGYEPREADRLDLENLDRWNAED